MAQFTHEDDLPEDFPSYGHNSTVAGYNSLIQALKVVTGDIERLGTFNISTLLN